MKTVLCVHAIFQIHVGQATCVACLPYIEYGMHEFVLSVGIISSISILRNLNLACFASFKLDLYKVSAFSTINLYWNRKTYDAEQGAVRICVHILVRDGGMKVEKGKINCSDSEG
ncbi:hypothetical protein VNO80_04036 [Phaseolus coccineus]|uniref:Uncharacterized protein n=1 Tax=Phaseolus coccineus TaxID=3886 RepID=A0AAN9RN17_PHACN